MLVQDLFAANTDTSTNTIQWTMAKILERLREEIDSVVEKTRLIQETDLPNLPYLQAVVKEGLRLHPDRYQRAYFQRNKNKEVEADVAGVVGNSLEVCYE